MTTTLKCLILFQYNYVYIIFNAFNLTITLRPSCMCLCVDSLAAAYRYFVHQSPGGH
jgi:hypothetical protein